MSCLLATRPGDPDSCEAVDFNTPTLYLFRQMPGLDGVVWLFVSTKFLWLNAPHRISDCRFTLVFANFISNGRGRATLTGTAHEIMCDINNAWQVVDNKKCTKVSQNTLCGLQKITSRPRLAGFLLYALTKSQQS